MMSGFIEGFKIKRVEPKKPLGTVIITYDQEEDILWIGKRCECAGATCIHAAGKILIEELQGVVVTVDPGGAQSISSIALMKASQHSLWGNIFGGLELALREGKRLQFFIDPSSWKLE